MRLKFSILLIFSCYGSQTTFFRPILPRPATPPQQYIMQNNWIDYLNFCIEKDSSLAKIKNDLFGEFKRIRKFLEMVRLYAVTNLEYAQEENEKEYRRQYSLGNLNYSKIYYYNTLYIKHFLEKINEGIDKIKKVFDSSVGTLEYMLRDIDGYKSNIRNSEQWITDFFGRLYKFQSSQLQMLNSEKVEGLQEIDGYNVCLQNIFVLLQDFKNKINNLSS